MSYKMGVSTSQEHLLPSRSQQGIPWLIPQGLRAMTALLAFLHDQAFTHSREPSPCIFSLTNAYYRVLSVLPWNNAMYL